MLLKTTPSELGQVREVPVAVLVGAIEVIVADDVTGTVVELDM